MKKIFLILLILIFISCKTTGKVASPFTSQDKNFKQYVADQNFKDIIKTYLAYVEKQLKDKPDDMTLKTKSYLLKGKDLQDPNLDYTFIASIMMDDLDTVKTLYKEGVDISKSPIEISYIQIASWFASLPVFKFLEEQGADLKSKYQGYNLLQASVNYGNLDVVKYLVEEKNEPTDLLTSEGANLLVLATSVDSLPTFKYLESKGLDLQKSKYKNQSLLYTAAASGAKNVFDYLIKEKGFDIAEKLKRPKPKKDTSKKIDDKNTKDKKEEPKSSLTDDINIFDFAVLNTKNDKFILYLLNNYSNYKNFKIDLDKEYTKGVTPLLIVLSRKMNFDLVKKMVQMGANLNLYDEKNSAPPIFYVIAYNKLDYIKFFIDNKAELNVQLKDGRYPFDVANQELPPSEEKNKIIKYLESLHAKKSKAPKEDKKSEEPKTQEKATEEPV